MEDGTVSPTPFVAKPLTQAEFEDGFLESANTAQEIALEIINNVVASGAEILFDHYLESKVIPYTARRALNDAVRIVSWGYVRCDSGQTVKEQHAGTQIGFEPSPSPIDVWAR